MLLLARRNLDCHHLFYNLQQKYRLKSTLSASINGIPQADKSKRKFNHVETFSKQNYKLLKMMEKQKSDFTIIPFQADEEVFTNRTRNAVRSNNRDDLTNVSFTLKVSVFSEGYTEPSQTSIMKLPAKIA